MASRESARGKPSAGGAEAGDVPIEGKTIKALVSDSLKRTHALFAGNYGEKLPQDENSTRIKMACKMADEYSALDELSSASEPASTTAAGAVRGTTDMKEATGDNHSPAPVDRGEKKSSIAKLIDSARPTGRKAAEPSKALVLAPGKTAAGAGKGGAKTTGPGLAVIPAPGGGTRPYIPSALIQKRLASKWPVPAWHAPWRCYRVLSGHLGWVRCVAFDSSNEWFVTGSGDRTIKIWDTASGQLKLTLTGHIEQVTGVAVSPRHPYMFTCGLDKKVMCWDLETNKVIRHYHGHLSGVYSLAMHPTLDVLCTGGRDSVCRVWDMRTKVQIHCLGGHDQTVCSIITQATDPQVVTGSHDSTIKLWDLRKGKTMSTLTYHKKSVRAMAMHPKEYSFIAASADNIKKYKLPNGEFLHNTLQAQKAIINDCAVNADNVMVTGGDDGSLHFWDWRSGNRFQEAQAILQPGSLDSEAGIMAMSFDQSGSRLVTCEADKSIKLWKEDPEATPETHPVQFRPPKDVKRW